MLHAFIDTNIYLDFYAYAADDLEELRKLQVAISTGELKLWSTEQLEDELRRNREKKIAESVKGLRDLRPPARFPQMARNISEFTDLETKRVAYGESVDLAERTIEEAARTHSLAADLVLHDLLDAAETIPMEAEIFGTAAQRSARGNPPGKPGSLGDAIHWECLLAAVPAGNDLYLVTGDRDFASPLDAATASEFLREEWRQRNGGDLQAFRSIGPFLTANFPDIRLAIEFEKGLKVRRLVSSDSFDSTRNAVSALEPYTEFSDEHAVDLLNAALDNSQINWIVRDADVNRFYRRLAVAHGRLLTERRQAQLVEELGLPAEVIAVEAEVGTDHSAA